MDWGVVAGVLGSVVAAIAFFRTINRETTMDTTDRVEIYSELRGDVKYIRDSIDDIKVDQKVMQKEMSDLRVKIITTEASANRANERLDEHMKHDHREV